MAAIKEKFESYERAVIPKTAGKEQREETEKAFYAGAMATFLLVMQVDGESGLAALNDELNSYIDSIITTSKAKQ